MNMMSSHDTDRMMTAYGGDEARVKQAVVFSMLFPGAVNIYYGEETGMKGRLNGGTRNAVQWENAGLWKTGMFDFYREIIKLRHSVPALRDGKFSFLKEYCSGSVLAFARSDSGKRAVCFMNCGSSSERSAFKPARTLMSSGVSEDSRGLLMEPCSFAVFEG